MGVTLASLQSKTVTWTCKHEVPGSLVSWLILWDQGGRESGPALCSRSYAIPSETRCGNTPRACVWAPAKDLSYSTTAKQYSTQRDNRQSFKWRKNFPFPAFQGIFAWSRRNRQGENQSCLFCLDASLHTNLESVASMWCKSLSIPVHVPSANSAAATRSRRVIAFPKLNLAAGRSQSLASSARITNQRAIETGPKRHASPILIWHLR